MEHEITKALREDGFLVVSDFLSPEMLEELKGTSTRILEELSNKHREQFKATGSLCNFGDHPEYADLVSLPEVAGIMEKLNYSSYKWLTGYLISKPKNAPPLFWHQDWWGWSDKISYQDKPLGLGFMYYLSDTTPENGCLRVIPGTHRNWHELHGLPEAHNEDLSRARDVNSKAFQSHPDEVAIEVSAGDLVIMDSRLLHSAYANCTDNERSLLTLWYLPEFDEMPGPIRNQLEKIFSRTDLDIDAGDLTPSSPRDWDKKDFGKIEDLVPDVNGAFDKPKWQRIPDKDRMKASHS